MVSAIGAFVDPKPCEIAGLDDFARQGHPLGALGPRRTTSRGKRVAIVGTGASAVQIVPAIARDVARLDVYQRTPIWVGPKFDPKIPGWLKTLFRRVPVTQRVTRAVASAIVEFILIFLVVNYRRVPFAQGWIENSNKRFLKQSVRDPELRRKLTPDYGMGCKRPSVSNHYLRTFNRDNVELVTDPIERVTPGGHPDGRRTASGRSTCSCWPPASGWRPTRRTTAARRCAAATASTWPTHYAENRLKSYEGVSMPELPNHFMIFGPYGWTGASWHVLVETASRHITRVIRECRARGATQVEVTPEATDRFHALVEKRMSQLAVVLRATARRPTATTSTTTATCRSCARPRAARRTARAGRSRSTTTATRRPPARSETVAT